MAKNQHVVPHQNGWAVRGAGDSYVSSTHRTQAEAIDTARAFAQIYHSEVVIHRPNGQIRDKDSHGNDPFPPRG